jgi:hypothetical protein
MHLTDDGVTYVVTTPVSGKQKLAMNAEESCLNYMPSVHLMS